MSANLQKLEGPTLKDELRKKSDLKKKENIKFIATILLSNLCVFLLCSHSQEDQTSTENTKIIHANYKMMEIPLTLLLEADALLKPETEVTLISKNKKVLAYKAYLHKETKKIEGQSHFKIEISTNDLMRVSENLNEDVIAIPVTTMAKVETKNKGNSYETNF